MKINNVDEDGYLLERIRFLLEVILYNSTQNHDGSIFLAILERNFLGRA